MLRHTRAVFECVYFKTTLPVLLNCFSLSSQQMCIICMSIPIYKHFNIILEYILWLIHVTSLKRIAYHFWSKPESSPIFPTYQIQLSCSLFSFFFGLHTPYGQFSTYIYQTLTLYKSRPCSFFFTL